MTDGRGGDVLRAVVVSGLCALLTAAGHVAGGGTLPDLSLLVVPLPLLAYGLVGLAGRCRGLPSTVGVLAVGQLVLHYLLELLHPAAHAGPAALTPGAQMLTMHALATLLIALALRSADRGATALVGALGRVLPRRLVPPPVDRPLPVLVVPDLVVPARLARAFAVACSRRGPPVA